MLNASDMIKTEALCTEEHAPHCKAACPLHVDMRNICALISAGKPEKAAEAFFAAVPLPSITAALCDAPCTAACMRARADASVAIGGIERALTASYNAVYAAPRLKLSYRVAVVGGGLCGLTVARLLSQKGIAVTLFEAESTIAPHLNVAAEILNKDFVLLGELVELRTGAHISADADWQELIKQYDAVFATGALPIGITSEHDPVTMQSSEPRLFIGGRRLLNTDYTAYALGEAKRAAVSIERLVKRVSLTAARVHEGAYQSGLHTDVSGAAPRPPTVEPEGGFSDAQLAREASRCLDCHCLICVRECKFLQKFEKIPRQYIHEIANTLILLRSGMRSGKNYLTACSMCNLCKTLCPNAIPMAQVVHDGRAAMHARGELSDAIYDFPVRDMLFSTEDAGFFRHAPGEERSEYVFFPGCQLIGGTPETVLDAYRLLLTFNKRTGIMLSCCGAPADWAGRTGLYEEMIATLKGRLNTLGNPTVIAACPTCKAQLEAAGVDTVSLYPYLDARELPDAVRRPRRVAVQDSCAAREDTGAQNAVRNLLARCGYTVEELDMSRERTRCCGYGGLVFYGDGQIAHEMITQRAAESPLPYAAYCSVCRDYLARAGKPALHVLDAVLGRDSDAALAAPGADISQKRYNRKLAVKLISEELYHEQCNPPESAGLIISDDVRALMERRLVTQEDAAAVIAAAEASGKKLFCPDRGSYIASLRPDIITYWVEYAQNGKTVLNAYSHRVRIYDYDGSAMEVQHAVPIENPRGVRCARCDRELAPLQVRAVYLKSDFPTRVLCCPECGQVYIPYELVCGKIAEVERTLEEK